METRDRCKVTSLGPTTIICGQYYSDKKTTPEKWVAGRRRGYEVSKYRPYGSVDRCADELHKGPPWKSGGPLRVLHYLDDLLTVKGNSIYYGESSSYYLQYRGGFVCAGVDPTSFHNFDKDEVADAGFEAFEGISSYGPTAWNRFKPGKPGADMALFVAELRDLPRMLRDTCRFFKDIYKDVRTRKKTRSVKNAAGNYVGTQFGWLPFLADMRKFYHTYETLDKRLKQMAKDNNQWVKRGGVVVEESEEQVLGEYEQPKHYPLLDSGFYESSTLGHSKISLHYERKVWFSARFKYYIPDIGSVRWKRRAKRLLFGASVNPALLWEAMPWSWLIDWATNVGDVLANLDNDLAENLTAKYAYLMGHTSKVGRVDSTMYLNPVSRLSWDFRLEEKVREEANPFGFGLTWDGLTSRQWSILGALGLDRLKH